MLSILLSACVEPPSAAPSATSPVSTIGTAPPTSPAGATPGPAGTVPDAGTGDTGPTATPSGPDWPIDETALYLNIGDSVAAGYDAAGQYGYGRLLHDNDDLLAPGFVGADLRSRSGAALVGVTESGATSADVLANLRGANLPPANGPVVATISAGGNDFNDDVAIMLAEPLTRVVAAELRANLGAMVDVLRDRYDEVHVYVLTIQDPTDGTGSIPPQYDSDLCGVIQAVPGFLTGIGVGNLQIVNDAIADEAAAQGVELVDYHGAFLGHGLTSTDGWMSGDCAHPTTLGHHELRRVIWEAWTGETP